MPTFGKSTAADWDDFRAVKGMHSEQPTGSDFAPADQLERGYSTGLSNLGFYTHLQEDSGDFNDVIGGGTSTTGANEYPTHGAAGLFGQDCVEFVAANTERIQWEGGEGRYANLTALAWVTWDSPDVFSAIVGNLSGFGSGDGGWSLRTEDVAGELSADVHATSGRAQATGGAIDDGNWHLVGLRWDGADLDLLIDGSVASTDSSQSGDADYGTVDDLVIGRRADSGNYWDGKTGHVMIFNTAISDSFHSDLYDTATGPVEYWADGKVS